MQPQDQLLFSYGAWSLKTEQPSWNSAGSSLRTSCCSATTPRACNLSSLYILCRDEVQPQDQLLFSYGAWSLQPEQPLYTLQG